MPEIKVYMQVGDSPLQEVGSVQGHPWSNGTDMKRGLAQVLIELSNYLLQEVVRDEASGLSSRD
jgi:hypothetical protein